MARRRLLCFPWAGGHPAAYQAWLRYLPPEIELWLVTPPGREPRATEPPVADIEGYLASVTEAVLQQPTLPLTLFGHSFGGVLAYLTALRLSDARRPPEHLVVSAAPLPGRSRLAPDAHALPDAELVALLRERFGGLPVVLEESPEFMQMTLGLTRTDLRLMSQCPDRPQPPLAMPISVFWSPDDKGVAESDLQGWTSRSLHGATFHAFRGGHFFVTAQPAEVTAALVAQRPREDPLTSRGGALS